MPLPKAIFRKSTYGIACLLITIGGWNIASSRHARNQLAALQRARPVEMVVDLAARGHYLVPFRQECRLSHDGTELVLLLPPDSMTETTLTNRLADVRFVCRLQDEEGTVRAWREFDGHTLSWTYSVNGAVPLIRLPPVKQGFYMMTLTVTQGAESMSRVPLKIMGRYVFENTTAEPGHGMLSGSMAFIGATLVAGAAFASGRREDHA